MKKLKKFASEIDGKILDQVRQFSERTGVKIRVCLEMALIEYLDKRGRYEPKRK